MRPGFRAVRDNWKPFVGLQLLGAGLVTAFYLLPAFREIATAMANAVNRLGLTGSALAAAFAGGALPEVARMLVAGKHYRWTKHRLNEVLFDAAFFALIGTMVALFYRLQTQLFGAEASVSVAVKKMLFDQLVFTAFCSIPITAVLYRWHELHYNARATLREIGPAFFLNRFLPVLIPAWCYWVPANLATYALPPVAQFLLYLGAQAAWSLLLVVIASNRGATQPAQVEPVPL
ncbi:MAG: hypothetical protein QM770_11970 [Tepidisphaeraceae bacterium]